MSPLFRTRPVQEGAFAETGRGSVGRETGGDLIKSRLTPSGGWETRESPGGDEDARHGVANAQGGSLATSVRVPQHLQALERANNVRSGRAALKRSIAAGRTDVSEVLHAPPSIAKNM